MQFMWTRGQRLRTFSIVLW